MTPDSSTLAARLARLQAVLAEREIDLAVLQYATDLYYYTGSVQPLYLLVPREGQARLLARKALTRIREEVAALPISAFAGTKDLLAIVTEMGVADARCVAFTQDTASYASVQRMKKLFPNAQITDIAWEVRRLRMVKEPEEIATIARAAQVVHDLPALVRERFTPGMSELELSAALEYYFRLHGHDYLIRCRREGVEMSACGVCVSGERTMAGTKFEGISGGTGLSPAVPYGATRAAIAPGVPILLDFAFVLEGYHLDQTRIACWGQPSPEIARAYDAMLQVEAAVFDAMHPGARWEDVYAVAATLVAELGYAEVFMGAGSEQVKFVGHGVGLELDEPPFLAPQMPYTLEAGMTLAIEPKVALPGIGVVGIEDTVVVREDGVERLTTCPQSIIVL